MEFLHTMVCVTNLDKNLAFYCRLLGLKKEERQTTSPGALTR